MPPAGVSHTYPPRHELDAVAGRRVFDCSPIGMALVSRDGRILRANRAMGRFLGYRMSELVGKTNLELTHPADHALTARVVRRVWATGRMILWSRKRYLHKTGKVVWGEANVSLMPDRCSGERCHLVQVIDITARKEAEDARRQSEQDYKALADSAPDLIVRFDADLRHRYVSPVITKIAGLSPEHFIGKTNRELGMPRDLDALWSRALHAVLRTARTQAIEFALETRSGRRFFQSHIAPERALGGRVQGIVSITRDVTEYRLLEDALRKSHDELEDKVKERTSRLRALARRLTQVEERERRRVAHVLHEDLQQILVATKIQLGLLQQELVGEPLRSQADKVLDRLDRSIAVSRGLSAELHPPVLHALGLADAFVWLADDMRNRFDLRVVLKAGKAPNGIPEDLRTFAFTAVRELMLNVVKHAGVKVASLRVNPVHAGLMTIQVSDRGVGFVPQTVAGQKLGLFRLRERAEALGGCLEITARPGGGTCATLTLPIQ
jgi:PAS domain S-box-containing protein